MFGRYVSLEDFQKINWQIYQINDDVHYTSTDIVCYLHRNVTHILKAVRKKKHPDAHYRLCVALTWVGALSSRFHIQVADEMWKRFPGHCPYCTNSPCACKERADNRQVATPTEERPPTLYGWQSMFKRMYPNNVLEDSAVHLAEEVGELAEAVRVFIATHSRQSLDNVAEEIVDVFANLFGIANCLNFDIAIALSEYYKDGCIKCHTCPCVCGYVVIDNPP